RASLKTLFGPPIDLPDRPSPSRARISADLAPNPAAAGRRPALAAFRCVAGCRGGGLQPGLVRASQTASSRIGAFLEGCAPGTGRYSSASGDAHYPSDGCDCAASHTGTPGL